MNGSAAPQANAGPWLRPPSPTLVTYVLRELMPPTLMGFGLFTFLLLMNVLLDLAQRIIADRVPLADVGLLFLYNVPHVIVLTVPMAVLVGGLIAFGRMSADSEIIALRSGGVSLYQLALPILLVGSAAAAITFYLCVVAMPWGNNATVQHQWRMINTRTIVSEVRPRVFENRFDNFTLWVEDVDSDAEAWDRLMLIRTDVTPPRVLLAETARLQYSSETRESWLELENGYSYDGGDSAEDSTVISFAAHEERIARQPGADEIDDVQKDERMMNLAELRTAIRERRGEDRPVRHLQVEVHKKFAIPAACLVMALVAVPLGASTRRHTKATGYLVAIGVIAIYYMFIDGGEKFAEEGAISPWLGVWAANLVIGSAALALLWSKARENDYGIADRALAAFDRIAASIRTAWRSWRGHTAMADAGAEEGAAAANAVHGRRFPRILDLYVLRQFIRVLGMTLSALVIIWMIGEYFEISDDVYEAGASTWIMIDYLKFQLPFILTMTIPIAGILTVLIVFSMMSKHNEVVAVLAGGISLFRLALPVLIPALALTFIHYAIFDYIAPYSNQRAFEIKTQLRSTSSYSMRPAQGNWMRGEGNYIFNFADYDADKQAFQGLRVYYLDDEAWRLSRIDYGRTVEWDDGRWRARDAWRRYYVYGDDADRVATPPLEKMPSADLPIRETPQYFRTEQRLPEQMSASELRAHIVALEARGFDASKYKIDLQQKFAFPAIVFVLALVGIPFGFRMGRQGTLSGVAVALGLTVMFWLTFVFFRAVGSAEILPPLAAAWAPHVLFLALAGYITAGLRT